MPNATLPLTSLAPGLVLAQIDILTTASSIIQTYPSITSAYLYGSYAKGTAHPDSDINIALFISDLDWDKCADKREEICGVLTDLESALNRVIHLSVCPPDDLSKWIKRSWVPIHPHCGKPTETMLPSSDEIKERLREMEQVCKDLVTYVDHVNSVGGVSKLDNHNRRLYVPAICDCVNRLGYSIKSRELGFDDELQKAWTNLRVITADYSQERDLSKVWVDFPTAMTNLLASIEAKLK
ncbi:hypothetical protein M378DRAFT_9978 [Amanita muscaria Koide BX008]|uniref:Polymerase beta nucleotidyltransferase domain-containing protein n=1 Tax=Amanita muscaria (strain Koide BX008) TaxID=946122 RepID=A0A0C2TI18_AMAMK|nr:hypothetical protein M378DRAFT_9978 [Amanita muscaria Koide BX008]